MSLLHDVLAWSEKDLSLWLRDAARRLFLNGDVTPKDLDELYILMKAGKEIAVEQTLHALPLGVDHIPAIANDESLVLLTSVANLTNVNKIASEQSLSFASDGISVVYGGNGAGKSGYARVLKHACRAREKGGEVLTDAANQAPAGKPSAQFNVTINGQPHTLLWESGGVPPPQLSTISVFDSNCASAYLVEGEAAYLPRGLDIVEGLANKVIPEVSARLKDEIDALDIKTDLLQGLLGDTEVGKLFANFNSEINVKEITRLGTLSEAELTRIAELQVALAEVDPESKAKQLKTSAAHVKNLSARIQVQEKYVNAKALKRLKNFVQASAESQLAVSDAAAQLRATDELLPGTGDSTWKALYFSAKKYSLEEAYKGQEYPQEDAESKCVLCQQPLGPATERMKRFSDFLNKDIAKHASDRQKDLDSEVQSLSIANLDFSYDDAIYAEIATFNFELANEITAHQEKLRSFKDWMFRCVGSQDWSGQPNEIVSPVTEIRKISAQNLRQCRTYMKAADAEKVAELTVELANLKARQNLVLIVVPILSLLDRMKLKEALVKCKLDLNPRPLSDKSKKIAGEIITGSLKSALDAEFEQLGVGHIKTKLKERIDRAKVKFTMLLDLPVAKKIDLILSEGEQRAVSLAAFLAELKLSNHKCGIVFDDPVSSLDHVRRRRVAQRLVAEAAVRQVIVLTHDIAFLSELIDAINETDTKHTVHHLEWSGENSGVVNQGLPWDKAGYKERVEQLKKEARGLEPWPPYPSDKQVAAARDLYSRIRATVEKVVEDVILQGVVTRFSDMVGVGNLHKITKLRQEDADAIVLLWKKCHRITGSHFQPVLKDSPVPNATVMLTDIESITEIVANIIKSRAAPAPPAVV